MIKHTLPAALLVAAGVAAQVSLAGPAGAAENSRSSVSFDPADEVGWTCSDGSQVGLGFDIVRNVHDEYDADGNLTLERRTVNYTGIFENLTSGERYTFQGTRVVTFDFVDGTFTSAGNYRTVTMPHAGIVLHDTGISVESLDVEGLVYADHGPSLDEWAAGSDAVCSLFGLQGA
jgi:hypothetical protein